MANETMIDKAMALLPGTRSPKKRATPAASRKKQVGDIQKKLAKLTRDIEKLAGIVAASERKAAPAKAGMKPISRKVVAPKAASRKAATSRQASRSTKRTGP